MTTENNSKVLFPDAEKESYRKCARQKDLRAADIVDIISACYKSSVARFSYKDLVIEFSSGQSALPNELNQVSSNQESQLPKQKTSELESVDRDDDMDLIITDPSAFEEMMVSEKET